jgi:CheY-like chemotaxis protein
MTPDDKLKYPLLIVEDDPSDVALYKDAIKAACNGSLWLDIVDCGNVEAAVAHLKKRLFSCISLDLNLPDRQGGHVRKGNGDRVREIALALNPLVMITMLTIEPQWDSALRAGATGVYYEDKNAIKSAREYGERFVARMRESERTSVWRRAGEILPEMLAKFCREASGGPSAAEPLQRTLDAFYLWETGIRLTVLVQLAALDFLGGDVGDVIKCITGRLDNEEVMSGIRKAVSKLNEPTGRGNQLVVSELLRFFGSESLWTAGRRLQVLRNATMHNPPVPRRDQLEAHLCEFVLFLFGMSFWGMHPLVTGVALANWQGRNGLKGRLIRAKDAERRDIVWPFDYKREIPVDPGHVYQIMVDPFESANVIAIPLFPLVVAENTGDQVRLWLAYNPRRDEYRDPIDGQTKQISCGLSIWWKDRMESHVLRTSHRIDDRAHKITEPQSYQAVGGGIHRPPVGELTSRIRSFLEAFYLSPGFRSIEEGDKKYEENFEGSAKADEVLGFLRMQQEIDPARLAYVSIGGADGSEIDCAMRRTAISRGICVEYSDYGAGRARERAQSLAMAGKELVIMQGDASQRLRDCSKKLEEWKQRGNIDGVLLSVQSVLHELPSRSPGFEPNLFLAEILRPFSIRLFFSREPAPPKDWPRTVQIRIGELSGEALFGISRLINDVLGFNDNVANLADDFVQMSSSLAIETLFKVLYCAEADSYRHEMEERVTSLNPERFAKILRNFVLPHENVEWEYLVSDTFRGRYKSYNVQARSQTGEKLGIPKCFVRITGVQALPAGGSSEESTKVTS